jgi:tetratricopeptide (TPR) repeat protein
VNLGVELAAAGRFDEAIEQYQQAQRVAPGDPTILYNLGNTWFRKGDPGEALRAYEEALRRDPGFAPAREAVQQVRKYLGQHGNPA